MSNDDPEVIDTLLYYLYHFEYDDEREGSLSLMPLNIELLRAADKYMIAALQALATEKFNRRAYNNWTADDFADSVEMLFESGFAETSLEARRTVMLEVVKEHATELFNNNAYGRFQMTTAAAPAFLFEYVRSITAEPATRPSVTSLTNVIWYKCPGTQCQKHAAIFGVRTSVPKKYKFNCPLRCTVDKDQTFWSYYKTKI